MQINAIKFRISQNQEPITYKFSQSSGKFANFQTLYGSPDLLQHIRHALTFALTGSTTATLFDTVLQISDQAGQTWIIHRTLAKVRIIKNGTEQSEEKLQELYASFYEHLDQEDVPFAIAQKKIVNQGDSLVAVDGDRAAQTGADVREVLEEQIAAITQACIDATGLAELSDPTVLIKLSQMIEPIYASYREICAQFRSQKDQPENGAEAKVGELPLLMNQLEVIRDLEKVAVPYLSPKMSLSKVNDDLASADAQIAELCTALGLDYKLVANEANADSLTKDFRKAIEAIARLEMFAKLIRSSQGARKYCEQKIEPMFKKYLEFADRNLASNRQIAAELESCLATLALRIKVSSQQPQRDPSQSLKTWFEKFKSKAEQGEAASANNAAAHNDFDTARLAIEYAVSQLNEMADHLKSAVTKHDSALGQIDDAHETLVAQYDQLKKHWFATAKAMGISADIDSTQMVKIVVAHGRLAQLIEHRRHLCAMRQRQENDLVEIESCILRWRELIGSQKTLDMSSHAILLREARDILRYKEPRARRYQQIKNARNSGESRSNMIEYLKQRRHDLVAQWEQAFSSFGMSAPAIGDRFNRELLKRASIVRGLTLAWASSPGLEREALLFGESPTPVALTTFDCSGQHFAPEVRLSFLKALENAEGNDLRLLLISDEQLFALVSALSIGSASRVVQAPAPQQQEKVRPSPVSKIVRAPQKPGAKAGTSKPVTQEQLSERARQMLELLAPQRK